MIACPARFQNCYGPVIAICLLFCPFRMEVSIAAAMSFYHYCILGAYRAGVGDVLFFSSRVRLRNLRSPPQLLVRLALI